MIFESIGNSNCNSKVSTKVGMKSEVQVVLREQRNLRFFVWPLLFVTYTTIAALDFEGK